MAGQHHVTGAVGDAVVRIGSEVVEELEHAGVFVLGGRVLLII